MTKREIEALRRIADRINDLSSLKNASFSSSEDDDKDTKNKIRPYLMWFECCSMYLNDLANAEEKGDKYLKDDALRKIERYCY